MSRRKQRLARLWPKSSGRMCASSSSRMAKPRGRGTGKATPRPHPSRLSLCRPLHQESPYPSPSPRPMNTFSGRTRQGARWGRLPFSRCRPRSPPGQSPGKWGPAPHQGLAQPQRSSLPRPSGKQVCVAGTPWPVQDLGTHCPGSWAKRATGEGQARTLGCELVGALRGDLGRKDQLLAIPGPGPGGAAQVEQGFGSTLTVTLCSGPDNSSACPQPVAGRRWGSSSSGHTACQSRLKFPLEDILQTRKRCPTRTRPSQPDSTMPHATLCLGTKVSRGGCDSGQTCLRTDMARRDMSQGRCV